MSRIIDDITGSDLNRLKQLFSPAKVKEGANVALSGVFEIFHLDFGVGIARGKKLQLTSRDIRQIRKVIKEQSGFDLLTDPIPNSRTDMAQFFPNEKLSSRPVKDKVIKVYGILSTNINGRKYDLEEGMNIEISLSCLKSIEHNQIVIVENYEAFSKFRLVKTDMEPNPLIVYRGDKDCSVISKEIALTFPDIELVAWFDTDPKGISLAFASGADYMLVPDLSKEVLKRHGRSDLFSNQYQNWKRVSALIPSNLELLMANVAKGISQESIIANDINVSLYKI
ncbi:hypothetical protein PVK64_19205 [Aliivibrio sp. S4TY2]|uniref:DUF7281 domain-containing protein n=1 Tax=unclassified Aliivibrio TaxID=2645654 RepID=UPI002378C5DB|nr:MULTISPECIES: hypothetical protein [unclassified Aliivibrio]MDD9158295.1 hypothetical protein [Aliivibrio sp. S4TY2]MDD9162210.1 hypothetical protein [Aliivibrio sp. S4TY1]MDD9166221.1 hypothetical protein [Aliivibrio sp. S4MY2]MDD9170246.1 hypothetical protein [Aliivibrio sp. S4MY4]MDD9187297.1 hypothetical protein [Aliivibrio sp. S4MY3]